MPKDEFTKSEAQVVFLEGVSGYFLTEFLQKVNLEFREIQNEEPAMKKDFGDSCSSINNGDFTKLKSVHFRCVDKTINDYIGEEHKKFFDKSIQELQAWTGIDMEKYHQYFELNHKNMPKRKRGKRKIRKQKEQPIRKLRNPKEYKIRVIRDGKPEWGNIIAEQAFQYRGYEFFIAYYHGWWVVSDVAAGIQIARHERYKKSIQFSKERIEKNFEKYVSQVAS
nr:hypothetical protein [Brevibacillus laterosporus]